MKSALKTDSVRIVNVSTLGFAIELPRIVDINEGQSKTILLPKIAYRSGFSSVDLDVRAEYDESILDVYFKLLV